MSHGSHTVNHVIPMTENHAETAGAGVTSKFGIIATDRISAPRSDHVKDRSPDCQNRAETLGAAGTSKFGEIVMGRLFRFMTALASHLIAKIVPRRPAHAALPNLVLLISGVADQGLNGHCKEISHQRHAPKPLAGHHDIGYAVVHSHTLLFSRALAMIMASEPFLPIEISAIRHPEIAPVLLRVARRVLIWIEPLLYRVMRVGKSRRRAAAFLEATKTKPPAFFADSVRVLCFDNYWCNQFCRK
ncbi:hypothetical protein GGX14DRAFT_545819 [Mycena pura]|uniref:Uncharacterized protein n=1 Tax=Mycena pura TaxID=153505 RepID=A0AAD6UZ79_9AGAR|nr:hypothetical protein GGX14DRAFT_545819 [Mycena pura]